MNPEDNPVDAAVSSLRIKEGKESESEVVIMDMLKKRICEQMVEMEYNESLAWALLHSHGNEDKWIYYIENEYIMPAMNSGTKDGMEK